MNIIWFGLLFILSLDCRICNRRRIKCDRRLPTCGKCEKRGLKCSGYGVILKWNQGVASRGNLKGKSIPVPSQKWAPTTLSILDLVAAPSSSEILIDESNDPFHGAIAPSGFEIGTIPATLMSNQLQNHDARRLLHHYDQIVAPNMAWADSPDNPWRHIIIPLALQSPPLLSSILAFAAKHINAVTFSNLGGTASSAAVSLSTAFQQQAVKLLAQELREFAKMNVPQTSLIVHNKATWDRSNAILATMLVLCNVETVWPDSTVWQVHLNAARTVTASRRSTIPAKTQQDSTSSFLEQELFIATTFASMTNFGNFMPNDGFNLGISEPVSIFVEFLKLLEMVTSLERQATTNPAMLTSSGISPSGLRKLFEHARSRTLAMGESFQVSGHSDYVHLSRTVNCFYHAGLIYSYRALIKNSSTQHFDSASLKERDAQILISNAELFLALDFQEPSKPTFAQDLVWPLFIAGTEASKKEEQVMVVSKLQQAMSGTGFSNCQHALEFLEALWERRDSETGFAMDFDWISFAREWTGQGRMFLVF